MYLSFMVVGVGLIFQIIFHVGTNEKNLLTDEQMHSQSLSYSANARRLVWTDYFKKYRFYLVIKLFIVFQS